MRTILFLLPVVASLATGCLHPRDSHRSQSQIADDTHLAKGVKSALNASPVYKFPYVRVATYNGVAQLSGFVVKGSQREEAGELARNVAGLKEVINNISILDMSANPELATGPAVYGPHR
jgi:osmotically-inducible protein OsmY